MLCEECGRKEAAFHYTEIINGFATELHLCEDCAQKKGINFPASFSFADLLGGLLESESLPSLARESNCKNCGLSYSDFKKSSFLGCSQCYRYFHQSLEPLLKKIHGSSKHIGKSPKKKGKEKERGKEGYDIELLQSQLKEAVAKEEFEEAAKLRDKIKEIEKTK